MEWKLQKEYIKHIDGYDGYYFYGYMDGYLGDPDYLQERVFTLAIENVYQIKRISEERYKHYSSLDSSNEDVASKLKRLAQMIIRYESIIKALKDKKNE
jgi:hypothetical protein